MCIDSLYVLVQDSYRYRNAAVPVNPQVLIDITPYVLSCSTTLKESFCMLQPSCRSVQRDI